MGHETKLDVYCGLRRSNGFLISLGPRINHVGLVSEWR